MRTRTNCLNLEQRQSQPKASNRLRIIFNHPRSSKKETTILNNLAQIRVPKKMTIMHLPWLSVQHVACSLHCYPWGDLVTDWWHWSAEPLDQNWNENKREHEKNTKSIVCKTLPGPHLTQYLLLAHQDPRPRAFKHKGRFCCPIVHAYRNSSRILKIHTESSPKVSKLFLKHKSTIPRRYLCKLLCQYGHPWPWQLLSLIESCPDYRGQNE
jgi:hypothetical protein